MCGIAGTDKTFMSSKVGLLSKTCEGEGPEGRWERDD